MEGKEVQPTKIEAATSNGNEQGEALPNIAGVIDAATNSQAVKSDQQPAPAGSTSAPAPAESAPAAAPPPPWHTFVRSASHQEIKERVAREVADILAGHGLSYHCNLALIAPQDSIDSYDLDKIFSALNEFNQYRDKDVILFILSRGGEGEPAYQISKQCKSFARSKFTVVVPRYAKSAATLIAIGADEIHMGPLGQLGPIDPQIDGLPALGVSQALKTIASVSELYPKSAEMFARYLRLALTVEQIGYCDRIAESATQYAERLLSTKPKMAGRAQAVAKELVHEYKDHNFVIDLAEAQQHLGADWIKSGTPELEAAEEIYSLIETINLFLGLSQSKRVLLIGGAASPKAVLVFDTKRRGT